MKFELSISDLNCFVSEIDLIKIFRGYAEISNIQIKRHGITNHSIGKANVSVNSQEEVERCINGVNKQIHFGYRISVQSLVANAR